MSGPSSRTRPLEALVIGAWVPSLADRDIESLVREAGLGSISRSAVSDVCREPRDRYRAFRARGLADVRLLALMLDAIFRPVRLATGSVCDCRNARRSPR